MHIIGVILFAYKAEATSNVAHESAHIDPHLHSNATESFHDGVGSFGYHSEHGGLGSFWGLGKEHALGHAGFLSAFGYGNSSAYGAGSYGARGSGSYGAGGMYGATSSAWGSENTDSFGQQGMYGANGSAWGAENARASSQSGTYGASGKFGTRLSGNAYGDKSYIKHEGYGGMKQDHLVGFHGMDYDLFGNGTLNHSYSKGLDKSYYGKGNDNGLVISKLMHQWGFGDDRHAIGGTRCGSECSSSGLLGPWGTGSTSSGGIGLHGGTYLSSVGLSDGRSAQSANIVAAMMGGGYGGGIGGYGGAAGGFGGHGLHGGQGIHGGHGVHGGHGDHGQLAIGSLSANGGGVVVESLSDHGYGGVIAGYSASGARGRTFKFSEKSIEASLSDYNRFFTASRLFTFNPTLTSTYKIVLVSTTKNYHPQMKIIEINRGGNEKYIEQFGQDKDNGIYSSRYALRTDREYLLEIGASEKIDFTPFMNENTGGFICIISCEKRSLQEILAQHEYKVSMWGKTAEVPLAHTEVLELAGDGKKEGCGRLDYSITPYYNEHQESITIFFHNETSFSNGISGTSKEAAKVEFECHHTGNLHQVFQGVEIAKRIVEFLIHCKTVCDLIDMLI